MDALPIELLDKLVGLAIAGDQGAACRSLASSCSCLRHAVLSTCTRLVLGGRTLPGHDLPSSKRCTECSVHPRPPWRYLGNRSAWQEPPSSQLRSNLLSLVSRARNVNSLRLQPQLSWLGLRDVLSAGGPSLAARLTTLTLSGRDDLSDLSLLADAQLVHLTHLDLSHCSAVKDLTPLASCTSIQSLSLCDCAQLRDQDLSPLAQLADGLRELSLCGCMLLEEVGPLSRCTSLEKLSLARCWCLTHVEHLSPCTKLTWLDLDMSPMPGRLGDLFGLSTLVKLQTLNLRSIARLQDLSPLQSCTDLQVGQHAVFHQSAGNGQPPCLPYLVVVAVCHMSAVLCLSGHFAGAVPVGLRH